MIRNLYDVVYIAGQVPQVTDPTNIHGGFLGAGCQIQAHQRRDRSMRVVPAPARDTPVTMPNILP